MLKIVPLVAGAAALALAGVALAGIASAGSRASTYTYRASLAPGGETPRPDAPAGAKGSFTASVTANGSVRTIRWKLTFAGLSGNAVGAHIHRGKAGVAGAVLVPLCGPCSSGRSGTARISKDVADVIEHGLAYVNVHTAKNAPGEIRGQVKLTGESGSAPVSGSTSPGSTVPSDGGGGGYGGY